MKEISRWHIHINGQVQGVGFRPFVFQLAQKFGLTGWVNNTTDGVHIEFEADEVLCKNFYDEVVYNAPQLAYITSHCIKKSSLIVYEGFRIIPSSNQGNPALLISPDFAMCENCRKEIKDKNNRRYNYAFATCIQCGPRYSIIKQLPYDRANTAMDVFNMCNRCIKEYNDPQNRRHFSQTNSCPHCAVVMNLYGNKQNLIEEDQTKIIEKICKLWNDGKIVAIKGTSGYLLTCDATNETVVKELRLRKHRQAKPFALMFPGINVLRNEVYLNEHEVKELQSAAAPIVLLRLKDVQSRLALNEIAPQLSKIGVMFPYTPLYELLLRNFYNPIVATSGNISNAPIAFEDETALNELNAIADYILVHNRKIITPQDDSVVQCSSTFKQRIVLRRARGFAPFYVNKNLALPQTTILALGASLKSSFTLLHNQNIHISQYFGDTGNYDTQQNFDKALHHFLHLFQAKPDVVIVDKHPGFFTTHLGEQLAKKWGSELSKVQHHEAHFASVLGEHNLLDEQEQILGIMWDGTGFGNDRQIWGGEFFIYHQRRFLGVAHFDYFNHFLGDKMATEPRLSAFSLCYEIDEAASILKPKFTAAEWNNYHQLIIINKLKTSSIGRMFDAVASLLGLIDRASYESEAAMLLEEEVQRYFKGELNIPDTWLEVDSLENHLSTQSLIRKIIRKIKEGKDTSEIAAWFHVQLVLIIKKVAIRNHCNKICFSGGVFQNGLLVDLLIKMLKEQHQLYFNNHLSCNDENVSFGQLMWYLQKKQ